MQPAAGLCVAAALHWFLASLGFGSGVLFAICCGLLVAYDKGRCVGVVYWMGNRAELLGQTP